MLKIKGIIFDLDGTLLDTLADIAAAMNLALQSAGLPVQPVEKYRYFVGDGVENMAQRALGNNPCGNEILSNLVTSFQNNYRTGWHNQTQLYPGIESLLDELYEYDIPIAILSNKPHEFTVEMVTEYLSPWEFEPVLGAGHLYAHKPEPDGALAISRLFRTLPEHIALVGDSNVDVKTALNANMIPIGVSWGFRSVTELRENGAKIILDQPQDLLKQFSPSAE